MNPNSPRAAHLALVLACLLNCLMNPHSAPAQNDPAPAFEPLRVDETVVGIYSNPARLQFEGLKTFPAQAIRDELMAHPKIMAASNPLKPLDAYIAVLREQIYRGFQYSGFPIPGVEVSTTPENIVIRIEEGNRYRSGRVIVMGATEVPVADLVARLTHDWSLGLSVIQGLSKAASSGLTTAYMDSMGGAVKDTKAAWEPGEPVAFNPTAVEFLNTRVRTLLEEFGYASATFDVATKPMEDSGLAELRIDIREEGPRSVLKEIVIKGNTRQSGKEILKLLELKEGTPVPHDLVAHVESRLWNCGRFLRYKVTAAPQGGKAHEVRLTVELEELEDVPALGDSLTPAQETLLRLHRWLNHALDQGEDLVITLRFRIADQDRTQHVEVILSRDGLLAVTGDAASTLPTHLSLALIVSPHGVEWMAPRHQRKLTSHADTTELVGRLTLLPNQDLDSTNRWTFSMTGGFHGGGGRDPENVFGLETLLAPGAFLGVDQSFDKVEIVGDRLEVSSKTMSAQIDRETGRPLQLTTQNEEENHELRLTFEKEAFQKRAARMRTATASHEELTGTNGVLTGYARFVIWEGLHETPLSFMLPPPKNSAHDRDQAALILDHLLQQGLLSPLDQLWKEATSPPGDAFILPTDTTQVPQSAMGIILAGMSGHFIRWSHRLFPENSWPQDLTRLLALAVFNEQEEAAEQMRALYHSGTMGPLGFYATARTLGMVNAAAAHPFVQRGLDRLGIEELNKDVGLLLSPGSELFLTATKWDAAIAALPEEDLKLLIKVLRDPAESAMRWWRRSLQQRPDAPMTERVRAGLEDWWNESLRETMAEAFQSLAAPTADSAKAQRLVEEARPYYEGQGRRRDYTKAVPLLTEAATLGHAGAQFLLANIYLEGRGVKRSDEQALQWFLRSAESGFLQAQVTLGDLYTDGVSLPLNRAEAAAWYGLAALQGNKPAAVLFRFNLRKLNAEEFEQVKERLEAFLDRQFADLEKEVTAASQE